jgi:glycosyltransferase involved in cell wall biosynthesis
VRAVLAALQRHGLLAAFHGTVALDRDAKWPHLLPRALRTEFERRRYDLPPELVQTHPWRELGRLAAVRLGFGRLTHHEHGRFSVDRVYRALDASVALALSDEIAAVYAYEDGALASFRRADKIGAFKIYDLPIAYWETLRRLMAEDSERLPAWAPTLGGGLTDPTAKLERKTLELEFADLVVTPSAFVADSVPAWAKSKRIVISPFGSPPPLSPELLAVSQQARARRISAHQPLRVLFAGSMGQRKGLGDLMAAVRQLNRKDVELVVMGSLQAPRAFYETECPGFTYEKGRPHAEVLALMRSCDVFCLPSLVEGRALVMQEAMSQGLPLIITPHTGGTDLVQETPASRAAGQPAAFGRSSTGFLVPIRSPEKIAEAISWCADHREETLEMGNRAGEKAKKYTWEAYGDRIVDAITRLMD